jgi:hypothetical protein
MVLYYIGSINPPKMNVFTGLKQNTKVMIVASALFLLSLSFSLLIFGHNVLTPANHLIHEVHEAAKADLLFVRPETDRKSH